MVLSQGGLAASARREGFLLSSPGGPGWTSEKACGVILDHSGLFSGFARPSIPASQKALFQRADWGHHLRSTPVPQASTRGARSHGRWLRAEEVNSVPGATRCVRCQRSAERSSDELGDDLTVASALSLSADRRGFLCLREILPRTRRVLCKGGRSGGKGRRTL